MLCTPTHKTCLFSCLEFAQVTTFKSGEVKQLASTDTIAFVRTEANGQSMLHYRLPANKKFYHMDVGGPVLDIEAGGDVVVVKVSDNEVKIFVHGDIHTLSAKEVATKKDAFHGITVDFAEIQQGAKIAAMKASKTMTCFLLEPDTDDNENHNGVAAQLFPDEDAD